MANGTRGDHPITDILFHRARVFTPEIDDLVRELSKLMAYERLYDQFDWFDPPPTDVFHGKLRDLVARLKKEGKDRGWEV